MYSQLKKRNNMVTILDKSSGMDTIPYVSGISHGSLFSGIGGFELGAFKAGIKTKWNCEIDEFNRKVLKKHFPNSFQYTDILTMENPEYVDIISGGFPCQDISIAKIKDIKGINGERSGLWKEMFRIISTVRPKYVVIENSPMLINRGLETLIVDFAKIGYVFEWQCLSATQFGFNHIRERFYGIAYTEQMRCLSNNEVFDCFQKVLRKETPRQNTLPMPIKRFNSKSNYELLRINDGFSRELDKDRIEACGNAIIPLIAYYLFKAILVHSNCH